MDLSKKVDKLQDLVQLDSGYKSGSGPCFMLFLSFCKLFTPNFYTDSSEFGRFLSELPTIETCMLCI